MTTNENLTWEVWWTDVCWASFRYSNFAYAFKDEQVKNGGYREEDIEIRKVG
jgi:undecaprenyl pyrophosphate synthase